MHRAALAQHTHSHRFTPPAEQENARRTILVVCLTGLMMIAEVVAGLATGSMALLADGWHMGSHVAALSLTAFAYWFARKHAEDHRYTFGTGKVGPLAGFASAILLGLIALGMAYESALRLVTPVEIEFLTALVVAAIGLTVNLASAFLLGGHHHHDHENEHEHESGEHNHGHHHHDHNLRAAYIHVLADALTSVLAIVALAAGALLGIRWLDPIMGIIGAVVILWWSWGLVRSSSNVLLDKEASTATALQIRALLEADADNRVADLHLWQVGTGHLALIVSVVTHHPRPPEHYRALLSGVSHLSHITVEVQRCSAALEAAA